MTEDLQQENQGDGEGDDQNVQDDDGVSVTDNAANTVNADSETSDAGEVADDPVADDAGPAPPAVTSPALGALGVNDHIAHDARRKADTEG